MNETTILHLSDIHFRRKKDQDNKTFYRDVQQKLISAIKSHIKTEAPPDFIAITGDIAFSGKKEEYEKALDFFKSLKGILPQESEFLPVPGNHDVNRQKVNKFFSLHQIVQNNKINEFLEKKEYIKNSINIKFKSFRKFSEQLNPGLYGAREDYFWVKDFPEKNISFLGLNSSWASEGDQEHFNIALGYPQVMTALEKSKISNRVVLMHHPPFSWLNDMPSSTTQVELFKNCQLLLHGHNHLDNALVFIDPSASVICLGANASYTNDKEGFIGFQFVTIRFFNESKAVKVKVWPYIFNERRNVFVPDRERWASQKGSPYFIIETGNPSQQPNELSAGLQIPGKYREWVEFFYSKMNIEQIDPNARAFFVPLPSIYIPIETANPFLKDEDQKITETRSSKSKTIQAGKDSKQKEPPFIDIEKLVSCKKCILLRGSAGMGKTTLVKHLAYMVIQGQGPEMLKEYLPVVVFLRKLWPIFQEEISYNKTGITFESLLQKYLENIMASALPFTEVEKFIEQGRTLFLLDGLDEIPKTLRGSLVELIAAFRLKYINNNFLLTGRPHGIDAGVKEFFGEFLHDIEYLDEKKISKFISQWLQEISRYDSNCAQVNAADMIADIQLHEHASLFTRNPLLLTALCIFYLESGKRIPEQRAELYDRILANFLYRRFHDPSKPGKANRIDDYLKHLAFLMQEQNLKIIDVGKAKELLKEFFPRKEESLAQYNRRIHNLFIEIEPRCGLLKRPNEGELEFFHLTFQEFMAAKYLLYTGTNYKEHLKKSEWHETLLLYFNLVSREQNGKAHSIIRELLNHPAEDSEWCRKLWLLGAKTLRDIQPYKRDKNVIKLAQKNIDMIIASDAAMEERFEAGEILGELEDPHIKSIPMVTVQAGEFTRGANNYKWEKPISQIYLDEFMIGKYPVTNEEYEAFIREGGYGNKNFWTPAGWNWKEKKNVSEPLLRHDRKWNGPNFPVVGVSWHEACAYAKWLSKKTGDFYELPTEAQWEKAARGLHGFSYPWGNDFDKSLCNTYEVKLNRTNPVGIFPKGSSPYGCFDMAGNVWEWCKDWYDANYYKDSPAQNPEGPSTGSFRIIRGGSWFNGAWRCRGAFRDYEAPDERLYCVGFRLKKLDKPPNAKTESPKRTIKKIDNAILPEEKNARESKNKLPGINDIPGAQPKRDIVRRILILSANPRATSRLRLDEEVREIEEGLRRAIHRDHFEIQSKWAVRLRDLRRALLDVEPHIVHFTGHGKEDGVLLEDELGFGIHVSAKAFSGLFELFSSRVECVILSACYSERQAIAIKKHINYVIGMRKEIKDKAAIEFAVGFYDALGAGRTVEEAFKFGCNAILLRYPDLSENLIPALYSR